MAWLGQKTPVLEICRRTGIAQRTFYKWKNDEAHPRERNALGRENPAVLDVNARTSKSD